MEAKCLIANLNNRLDITKKVDKNEHFEKIFNKSCDG